MSGELVEAAARFYDKLERVEWWEVTAWWWELFGDAVDEIDRDFYTEGAGDA